jgi:hypothetical protein
VFEPDEEFTYIDDILPKEVLDDIHRSHSEGVEITRCEYVAPIENVYLADVVAPEFLEELSSAFGLAARPIARVTQQDLRDHYTGMIERLTAHSSMPNQWRQADVSRFKASIIHTLTPVDYQASWLVLRMFGTHEEEFLHNMTPAAREEKFVQTLYANRRQFSFFMPRHKLVRRLAERSIIEYSRYAA